MWRRVLIGVIGIVVVGIAGAEHLSRRGAERRLQEATEARRKLELQFGEVAATHERVKQDLRKEQQRSAELAALLTSAHGQLEQTQAQLTEQTRSVRGLQVRLSALQRQMDQLQGELAVTLQEREGAVPAGANAVQIERIVVSDAGTANSQGRIVSVHQDWNFVVIDLGWDTVRIGDTVSIFRDQQLLAKARVDRVQEGVCAATVLPEWRADAIRVNDLVRLL